MPKYTVQNGSVVTLKDPKITDPKKEGFDRVTHKVGAEIELDAAAAQKMDPTGFYLCPSNKYRRGKTYTPKSAVTEDDEDNEDEDDLEKKTAPAKPSPAK